MSETIALVILFIGMLCLIPLIYIIWVASGYWYDVQEKPNEDQFYE